MTRSHRIPSLALSLIAGLALAAGAPALAQSGLGGVPKAGGAMSKPATPAAPASTSGTLLFPPAGSVTFTALVTAARPGVEAEIGQPVGLVVSRLATLDGWAYLQATPVAPDGGAIDWATTPFAEPMREGFMSDVYMALLREGGAGWELVDHEFGPTDVAWYGWVEAYGLPETLFYTP